MAETPQSRRRGRPAGPRLLTLEGIVDTALALLDADGPTGLSIRRVAAVLGVHNNAIYTYVANRPALESAIVERLLREADPSLLKGPKRKWRRRLTSYATSFRDVLRNHPGAMTFFMTAPLAADVALDITEAMQRCFIDAGLDGDDAARATYIASVYVTGYSAFDIAETNATPPLPTDDERARQRFDLAAHLDPLRYPLTTASATTIAAWVSTATFEWGLERTLDGLVSAPGPSLRSRETR